MSFCTEKSLALVAAALFFAVTGCSRTSADPPRIASDPADAPRAADEIVERLGARDYDALYEGASGPFKAANPKDEFVAKLRQLEGFGELDGLEPKGDFDVKQDAGAQVASRSYTASYELGRGPFELALREDGAGGWRLDYFTYDIGAETFDPPYAADETGADRLVHRFLYLWQNRRYDDIAKTMQLEDDPAKAREYFKTLESAGNFLSAKRTGYVAGSKAKSIKTDYDVVFDNGKGFMTFTLVSDGQNWHVDNIRYDVEYRTGEPGKNVG